MQFSVLVPHEFAERCYLREVLFWAGLFRFPLKSYYDLNDFREALDLIEGIIPPTSGTDAVTREESARVGLPPNPIWEELLDGESYREPSAVQEWLRSELPELTRRRLQNDLEASLDYRRRRAEWDAAFDAYIDVYRARLFLMLREGRIPAFGKSLPRASVSTSIQHLDATKWEGWGSQVVWTPIPADFWLSNGIDWAKCTADGADGCFALILVDAEALLREFPYPENAVFSVKRVGDNYVIDSDEDVPVPSVRQGKGRPPFDWDELHLEMASRVRSGLPPKQEALIAEMQDWCRRRWGKEVARSTLLGKIKPYYDTFVRKSENGK